MNNAMQSLRQRWQALAPREQWLSVLVGASLLGMLYLLLVAEPLAERIAQQNSQLRLAEVRQLEANNALLELQAKLAADPNRPIETPSMWRAPIANRFCAASTRRPAHWFHLHA